MNPFEDGLTHYLSPPQLQKIQARKIGLGGAGGLGSNVAMILVRTGFKHFEIIDADTVDISNLNRQQYFLDDVGQDKAESLRKHLLKINPNIDCRISKTTWTSDTGDQYFGGCDFIIEAFDVAEYKSQFVEYYQDKAAFVISGNGLAGFSTEALPVRKVDNIFLVGDTVTGVSQEAPPLAPRVTTCAAMMAGIVLDLALKM